MIDRALYTYLTDPADLPGLAARKFVVPQILAGITLTTRNDARRYLRERVGDAIYSSRRPRQSGQHSAVTLQFLTGNQPLTLTDEHDLAEAFISIDCWTRGGDAPVRANVIGNLIRLATNGYYADYWGDTWIAGCSLERISTTADTPPDAADDWTHRYSFDLRIHYTAAAAAY